MAKVKLETIKAREKAATPGPWTKSNCDSLSGDRLRKPPFGEPDGWDIEAPCMEVVDHEEVPGFKEIVMGGWDGHRYGVLESADSEFIAHAREDIPWLVSEVERLTEAKEYLAGRVEALSAGKEIYDE